MNTNSEWLLVALIMAGLGAAGVYLIGKAEEKAFMVDVESY